MVKRVAAIETLAVELFKQLHDTMPAQYREKSPSDDDYIWRQWHIVYGTAAKAVTVLAYLSRMLHVKAGKDDTGGPAWEFIEENRKLGLPTCEDLAREVILGRGAELPRS